MAPTKPLSERQKKAAEKAWQGLTTRQKKALDPKKYDREVKAAAKQKDADKKAALKAKEKAKKEAAAAKKKAVAKKAVKKVAKKAVKKVAKKAVAKKTPAKKVSKKAAVKKIVKKVLDKAAASIEAAITLPEALPSRKKKGVDAQPRITTERKVSALDGHSKTYLVLAEKPKGSDAMIAVRLVGGDYRIHAFPTFAAHGITDPNYTKGAIREPAGDRGQYQRCWVNKTEFVGFMNKLRESNLHAHIVDDLLISRLHISKPDTEAVSS